MAKLLITNLYEKIELVEVDISDEIIDLLQELIVEAEKNNITIFMTLKGSEDIINTITYDNLTHLVESGLLKEINYNKREDLKLLNKSAILNIIGFIQIKLY